MNASVCKSCGARINWVELVSGKRMPLDPTPTASGNICIDSQTGKARYSQTFSTGPRYTPHFATCPQAASHRKAR